MKQLQKFFRSKASSINEAKYQATFVISDESVDRQGEVIKQDGWDLENFKKNPVVLFGHDSWKLPIGKAIKIYAEGDKTYAVIEFAVEIYDKAKTIWEMVKAGILNTVSVGFMNNEYLDGDDYENVQLTKNELLEISIVPIPANPNAIVLAAKDGLISKKDAQFLTKAMEKELEGLRPLTKDDKLEGMEQLQQFITESLQPVNDKLASLEQVINGDGDKEPGLVGALADIKTDIDNLQDTTGDGKDDAGSDDEGKDGDATGDADGKPGDKPGGTDGDEVDPDDLTEDQAQQVTDAVAAALADGDSDGDKNDE